VIAVFAGRDGEGHPCISIPGSASPGVQVASASCPLADLTPGAPLAVIFIDGDPGRPLILGAVTFPPAGFLPWEMPTPEQAVAPDAVTGEELHFSAEKQISLTCGKASITLTESGKVIIRGTHLLSRATGANRIQGGSIELN